jgi:hypothetical protein
VACKENLKFPHFRVLGLINRHNQQIKLFLVRRIAHLHLIGLLVALLIFISPTCSSRCSSASHRLGRQLAYLHLIGLVVALLICI